MSVIKREPVAEQVMRNLQQMILERNYQPGDKMPTEKEVCEIFHVGRSTVREAYRMMQIMGILESRQGSGTLVADRDDERIQASAREWFQKNGRKVSDYMEVRMALEPMATRLAAERASEEDIQNIKKIHGLFCDAVKRNDVLRMPQYDEEFHHSIAEASHNLLFVKMEKILSECILEYRKRSFSIREQAAHAVSPHEAVVQALCNRDPETGEEAMRQHIRISLQDMESVMKQ